MDTNKIFIDMAQRAHEFAEMCRLMQKIPDMPLTAEVKDALDEYAKRLGLPKADPEAWREEYRKKKEAGVKFEKIGQGGLVWLPYVGGFENGIKEDYREVPQAVSASECQKALEHLARTYSADKGTAQLNPTIPPHAAERALWKAQRDAGTNEVWKWENMKGNWLDLLPNEEPQWMPGHKYRVKPKPVKLTAKIMSWAFGSKTQEWEFFGTPDEYRAECEKYGYAVVSEINEVVEKPKTEKYYFCLMRTKGGSVIPASSLKIEQLKAECDRWGRNIIGDIEEREVTIE